MLGSVHWTGIKDIGWWHYQGGTACFQHAHAQLLVPASLYILGQLRGAYIVFKHLCNMQRWYKLQLLAVLLLLLLPINYASINKENVAGRASK
jgi:hypothetical protein